MRLLACLIVAPQRGYDEPAILSYAISSFCPTSADGLQVRTGRNYRFNAAGNSLTAALMGLAGQYVAKSAIFFGAAALCVPALIALSRIRPDEIDYARARNAGRGKKAESYSRSSWQAPQSLHLCCLRFPVPVGRRFAAAGRWPEPRSKQGAIRILAHGGIDRCATNRGGAVVTLGGLPF